MTSDEVLDLDHVPDRVAVIGGGAIGCEFASTFADLGAEVTILEGLPKILPGLDADLAKVVEKSFKKKKIAIRTGVMVKGHTPNDSGGTTVAFGDDESVEVDAVVVSVGRRPFADRLGLDGTGVVVDERGFVQVDEYCRTGEPGVYAVGDLIATPARPRRLRRGDPGDQAGARRVADADHVRPGAVGDLLPPRGGVGRPRRGAGRAAGHDVVVAKHPFKFNSRAQILGETEGLVKIIANATRRLRRPGPRRAHGGPLGHRAAQWWLPRRQLGSLRRRGGRVHPAAPQPVGGLRRDRHDAHRTQLQRLTRTIPDPAHDPHAKDSSHGRRHPPAAR
jgi:dihydrolipoamide dehydrogenase